ncbi:MAG: hypothetical protein P1V33_12380, partial [Pseudohongiella nitratireducens]
DTLDLGSSAARCESSSLSVRTIKTSLLSKGYHWLTFLSNQMQTNSVVFLSDFGNCSTRVPGWSVASWQKCAGAGLAPGSAHQP